MIVHNAKGKRNIKICLAFEKAFSTAKNRDEVYIVNVVSFTRYLISVVFPLFAGA